MIVLWVVYELLMGGYAHRAVDSFYTLEECKRVIETRRAEIKLTTALNFHLVCLPQGTRP